MKLSKLNVKKITFASGFQPANVASCLQLKRQDNLQQAVLHSTALWYYKRVCIFILLDKDIDGTIYNSRLYLLFVLHLGYISVVF